MTVVDTAAPPSVEEREFSYHDHCDVCGFQAYFVALKGDNELLFCAHHGNEHAIMLKMKGWTVFDFSARLDTPAIR